MNSLSSFFFFSWLLKYRYLAIFPIAVFEGPILTVIVGFLASLGIFNLLISYTVIVLGDLTGDSLHYAVGRYGGRKFIEKWGRYVGLSFEKIEPIERQFEKRGNTLLFWGKAMHGLGGAFLIAAGLIHMPFRKFILSNFWPTLLKSAILLMVGFFFGQSITHIKSILDFIAYAVAGAVALAVAIYFFYVRGKTKTDELK
ncbi:MAG: DedA family protein [Minisyncoccia bacterium]|jgi:membrane protein DedA with SNARE-associated domain